MSSKYEDSREETSYFQRKQESSHHGGNARSRSPFNVSQNPNTGYVKENVQVMGSPSHANRLSHNKREFYEVDDGTTILHQKPVHHNTEYIREYDNERVSYPKQVVHIQEEIREHRGRDRTPTRIEQDYHQREVLNPNPPRDERPRHRSPRTHAKGSPARAGKKVDTSTEMNILSRFISNKLVNKTIEDMVFELVPQLVYDAQNPRHKEQEEHVVQQKQIVQREPSFDFERKKHQTEKAAKKAHNKELMNVIETMDKHEEGAGSDVDDVDEGTNVNKIVPSSEKTQIKNYYVNKRLADSMGVKFETNKRINGVKAIPFQEKDNYPMIDVKSKVSRPKHEI